MLHYYTNVPSKWFVRTQCHAFMHAILFSACVQIAGLSRSTVRWAQREMQTLRWARRNRWIPAVWCTHRLEVALRT